VADCDGLGEALGVDGDGEAEGLSVADGGGTAGAGGAACVLSAGGVDTALLDGTSGTLARRSSGSALFRDGAS
jgi:hypothetical protein